jgi:hypothetical protein
MFLEDRPPRQHRELFTPSVQGTTWLEKDFCLGSANRGNFWVQQRALVAYWGGPERPACYAQLRLMHDDYDFSSALVYTTQERNRVLGLVNFRNPGGDKHVNIDMIRTGEFTASSLRLRLDISDPSAKAAIENNKAVVKCGKVRITFHVPDGVFGKNKPAMRIGKEEDRLAVLVDLLKSDTPQLVKWSEIGTAWLAFTFAIDDIGNEKFFASKHDGRVALRWGDLELTGGTTVADIKTQEAAFSETRGGKAVPAIRLSEQRLA